MQSFFLSKLCECVYKRTDAFTSVFDFWQLFRLVFAVFLAIFFGSVLGLRMTRGHPADFMHQVGFNNF